APVNAVSCPKREVSTVAPQALWLLNNPTAARQATAFAERLVREAGKKPEAWVERCWRVALGRPPTATERDEALALLNELGGGPRALARLCRGVFTVGEFVHVD